MDNNSYSKGVSWISDCRIPFANPEDAEHTLSDIYPIDVEGKQSKEWGTKKIGNTSKNTGRFPANILVSDDMLNDGSSGGSSYCPPTKYEYEISNEKFLNSLIRTKTGIGDKGSNSRYHSLDKWFENLIDG